jgi:hypothetical protein
MIENKKQNVSIRMNVSDLRKIKVIAKRLNVRESDVFRFAIKSSLSKLAPLHDIEVAGSDLLPVFIEYGSEIASYFDLDAAQLDRLVNGSQTELHKRVDRDDLEMVVMLGRHEQYVFQKLKGSIDNADAPGAVSMLKQHLYEKYVSGSSSAKEDEEVDNNTRHHHINDGAITKNVN